MRTRRRADTDTEDVVAVGARDVRLADARREDVGLNKGSKPALTQAGDESVQESTIVNTLAR